MLHFQQVGVGLELCSLFQSILLLPQIQVRVLLRRLLFLISPRIEIRIFFKGFSILRLYEAQGNVLSFLFKALYFAHYSTNSSSVTVLVAVASSVDN